MTRFLMLAICLAVPALAQSLPSIRSIVNAASNTDPLLPNSSIARGSMFVIKGENMGPQVIVVDTTFPLDTTFQGTSVKVTSLTNNLSWDAIIYYSGATQVAAILPSAVPEGIANVRVSSNGQSSQNFQIDVVKNSVGLFSVNSSGAGDAIATNNSGVLSPTNPARPNDTIVLWGTGLGPIDGDEKLAAPQFDMTTVPVEAWVGGKPATIVFRGRNACCTSVDTVYLRVPAGLAGCMTPVTLKVGNTYSNTVLIPTTQSGNICTPTTPSVTAAEMPQLVTKTNLWFGSVALHRAASPSNTSLQPIANNTFDGGVGSFSQVQVIPGWLGFTNWDIMHTRSCNASTTGGFNGYFSSTALSAGTINVNGPGGRNGQLNYDSVARLNYGTLGASGDFVVPGNYDINTGFINNSGATVSLNLPSLLTWTNRDQISRLDRSTGVTVNWSGGDPNGFVQIVGASTLLNGRSDQLFGAFLCIVPASDRTFTIPPYILAGLPLTEPGQPAVLVMTGLAGNKRMTGGGLDLSYSVVTDNIGINVTYR